jgi:predicted TIM-barrel fold metal-dependent hydrolase
MISADPARVGDRPDDRHIGADYFIWASDYPHIDASFGVVKELRERLAPLSADARRKVLGDNALRFYKLAA